MFFRCLKFLYSLVLSQSFAKNNITSASGGEGASEICQTNQFSHPVQYPQYLHCEVVPFHLGDVQGHSTAKHNVVDVIPMGLSSSRIPLIFLPFRPRRPITGLLLTDFWHSGTHRLPGRRQWLCSGAPHFQSYCHNESGVLALCGYSAPWPTVT